jgi:uncharacterized membrane protein YoaK (UPF0700 family)
LFGFFVGLMTGNILVASGDIAAARAGSLTKVAAVPAFLLGAAASAVAARAAAHAGRPRLPLLCFTWSALVACFAIAALVGAPFLRPDDHATTAVAAIGAFAMGWLSALSRDLLPEMPSAVVMTTNVTKGMINVVDLSSGDRRARGPLFRLVPTVVAFAAGAAAGAALFEAAGFVCLIGPGAIGLACGLLARGVG